MRIFPRIHIIDYSFSNFSIFYLETFLSRKSFFSFVRTREKFKDYSARRYPGFLDAKKNSSMAIIGCGDGPHIELFSQQMKKIIAIDIDKDRLKLSKELIEKNNIMNCVLKKGTIYDLSNIDEKVDYIILIDVIEHLENPKKALKEMRKILKKDGSVLITFPNMWEIYYAIGKFLNKYIMKIPEKKGKKYDYHQIKMLPWRWMKLFRLMGYNIKRVHATTMFPPLHWFGVKPIWFTNNIINKIDSFICKSPFKYFGQSMIVVMNKKDE